MSSSLGSMDTDTNTDSDIYTDKGHGICKR